MMATTATNPAPFLNDPLLNALEGLRFRLSTLASALDDYFRTISSTPTYPPWSVLSTKAANVSAGMAAVSEHMAVHHSLLGEYGVFPNATFPGHTEPGVLMQLLRKKLEPGVEDWLVAGGKVAERWVRGQGGIAGAGKLARNEWETLWKGDLGRNWSREDEDVGVVVEEEGERESDIWLGARKEAQQLGHESQIGMLDYTEAEMEVGVENVRTGLKRELRADPDDDYEEEEEQSASGIQNTDDKMPMETTAKDDKMVVDTTHAEPPPMDMNDYLKFLNMGIMPPKPAPMPTTEPGSTSAAEPGPTPAPGTASAPTSNEAPT